MKIVLMFGMPGSGKGTQSKLLSRMVGFKHISTGELVRKNVKKKSVFGGHLQRIMALGGLVSDRTIDKMVKLELKGNQKGVLLDGFPRDKKQAKFLLSILSKKETLQMKAVNLKISEKKSIERIIKRSKIENRADDNASSIAKRMKIYHSQTEEVLSLLKKRGVKVINIDGDDSVRNINKSIIKKLF